MKTNKYLGFTVVELLVVAPIIILLIGVFISAIIAMTGDVLSSRGESETLFDAQYAVDMIERDVKTSAAFLATNNILLTSPQGKNNDTTKFSNADTTIGSTLILNSYITTSNPISENRNFINYKSPNACDSTNVSENDKLTYNIVYFTKLNPDNGKYTLWRRVIMPVNYATIGCSQPWQQPSCSPESSDAFCKAKDIRILDGIEEGGFVIKHYLDANPTEISVIATSSSASDSERQSALIKSSKIGVTISSSRKISGKEISQTKTLYAISPNNNISAPIYNRVKVLVVAGGGSGSTSNWGGGGGGGGGVLYHSDLEVFGSIPVIVGEGGASVTSGAGLNGGNSYFGALTAFGGGGGMRGSGGSGGGDGHSGLTGSFGLATQTSNNGGIGYGNNGGYGTYVIPTPCGGGGGAGGPGGNGIGIDGGAGGPGMAFDISGKNTYYAGGGGSSDNSAPTKKAPGGIGGGGGGEGVTLFEDATERTGSNEYLGVPITTTAMANLGKTITIYADIKASIAGTLRFYSLGKYKINNVTYWPAGTDYQRVKMVGNFSYDLNGTGSEVCTLSVYGTYDTGVIPSMKNIVIMPGDMDGVDGLGGGGSGNKIEASGKGGNGIVIVSYPTGTMTATGGTIGASGLYTIHTFTSNDTFTVTS